MADKTRKILAEINALRAQVEAELESRREKLGWRVHDGFVSFEQGISDEHKKLRVGIGQFLAQSNLATILTAPLIYSLIVPFVLIDIWTSLYQAVCFRAYGIERVKRSDYISYDRHKLRYLNWIEVLNCTYCSYGNGVIAYVREVASRTEQYWCPIKHAMRLADTHPHYSDFIEYGDAQGYRDQLTELRDMLREKTGPKDPDAD